jgi:KTSC domain
MQRSPLASTTLAAVAYQPEDALLEVEFRDGTLYHFFDVPAGCFEKLLAAASKGGYFNSEDPGSLSLSEAYRTWMNLSSKSK